MLGLIWRYGRLNETCDLIELNQRIGGRSNKSLHSSMQVSILARNNAIGGYHAGDIRFRQ